MALFPYDRDGVSEELSALRKQVADLARSVAKGSSGLRRTAIDEHAELYDTVSDWIARAMPAARYGARRFERTIRDDPARTVAVAGLLALGVAAAVFFSRSRR